MKRVPGSRPALGPRDGAGHPTHPVAPLPVPRAVPQRHSVRGQVLAALRHALAEGELSPGTVYSAPGLAQRFGVSATPVREAMQSLAAEGLVEVVPNRGFRVLSRSPRELRELAEVRALLELPVLLTLARTLPARRFGELRPLAESAAAVAASGDQARYAEADRAFHRALLTIAGNEQLVLVADDLHRRAQWPPTPVRATRTVLLTADAAEHLSLLDALVEGDQAAAETLLRQHFSHR